MLNYIKSFFSHIYFNFVLVVLFLYETSIFLGEIDTYSHSYNVVGITPILLALLIVLLLIYDLPRYFNTPKGGDVTFWKRWVIFIMTVVLPIHLLFFAKLETNIFILQYIRLFLLPGLLYVFFRTYFARNNLPAQSLYIPYFIIWVVLVFFYFRNIGLIVFLRESQELTYSVNFVYYIILLLPVLMLSKLKAYFIPFLITAVAVALSGKRGGLFVILAMIAVPPFFKNHYSNKVKNAAVPVLLIFVVGALLFVFSEFTNILFDQALSRITSLKEDKGSGRLDIWEMILSSYFNNGILSMIFGHGFESTKQVANGLTSHNDLIEVLYNYGMISLLILLSFYKMLLSKVKLFFKLNSNISVGYTASVIVFVFLSNVSHIINYPHFMLLLPVWAYAFSNIKNKKI